MSNDREIDGLRKLADKYGLQYDDAETIDQAIEALHRCDVAHSAAEPRAEPAVHEAITRALAEAGVKQEVLVGMCIEVGLEAYRDALNREAKP